MVTPITPSEIIAFPIHLEIIAPIILSGMVAFPIPSEMITLTIPSEMVTPITPLEIIVFLIHLEIVAPIMSLEIVAPTIPLGIIALTILSHLQVLPQQSITTIGITTSEMGVSSYYSRVRRQHPHPLKYRTTISLKDCKAHQVHTSQLTECVAEPMRPRWRRTQAVS